MEVNDQPGLVVGFLASVGHYGGTFFMVLSWNKEIAIGKFYCDPYVVLKRKHSFISLVHEEGRSKNPKWFGGTENPTWHIKENF